MGSLEWMRSRRDLLLLLLVRAWVRACRLDRWRWRRRLELGLGSGSRRRLFRGGRSCGRGPGSRIRRGIFGSFRIVARSILAGAWLHFRNVDWGLLGRRGTGALRLLDRSTLICGPSLPCRLWGNGRSNRGLRIPRGGGLVD